MTVRDKTLSVIAAILHVNPASLSDSSSPDTIESWDSLQHTQLILALEEEFTIAFTVDEFEALQTVGALVASVEAHANGRQA
jgi:acyl carrier protein